MLQAAVAVHIGTDNLNVERHADRIIQRLAPCKPSELMIDGDLLCFDKILLDQMGLGLTGVTTVKGHATGEMVASGQVRALDKAGNDQADDAADFGGRRVPVGVIDSRCHVGVM